MIHFSQKKRENNAKSSHLLVSCCCLGLCFWCLRNCKHFWMIKNNPNALVRIALIWCGLEGVCVNKTHQWYVFSNIREHDSAVCTTSVEPHRFDSVCKANPKFLILDSFAQKKHHLVFFGADERNRTPTLSN